ncbi:pyrimidine (deoxy)nucleoside triphosphate diphosphatase [Kluyvera genomosp. 1]|uniref:pyrimidine (deoxy)nucleoside triphosphate diphosphatase n=1 Tax=Kluyvera genomosp. 1 TaxID=2774053 RepID=UPI00068A6CE7|nr:pyrimidine (deoxy)nucleoside triphosphate diphosphatase [Kluyvera genomosp. 1]
MLKTIDVVAAIIEQNGKILLAQRPLHADQAGLWEFAGGKVEAGESQREALIRELQEELAIHAYPARYIASHQREVSGRIIHLHAWHVPRFDGEMIAREHSALVWCTPQEALDYALAPADVPLLKAFMVLPDATPADSC